MAGQILDGKALAAEVRGRVSEQVSELKATTGVTPGLAAVLVGSDPASVTYVGMKRRACEAAGMVSTLCELGKDATQQQVLETVRALNEDPAIDGILVQHPIPSHLDEGEVFETIAPDKDVDGVTTLSLGKLLTEEPGFVPATAAAVMELLRHYEIPIKGQKAVVIGRSKIVGKPVAFLLLNQHATVTICHSRTTDLAKEAEQADILVVAINRPEMVTGDMVKKGAVVIDVGYSRDPESGQHTGDVHYPSAREKASYITPVPGGVGPMTIAMLLSNTLVAAKKRAASGG